MMNAHGYVGGFSSCVSFLGEGEEKDDES